ncbi:hypothetical protein K5V21_17190 [Clostridium sardiniense]|uniref:DUF4829 domain-containing protein n=1 Tax=Clostridium sardiniense TaxID=29369 RepID=A0ABS7L257_CLOSR|nr:hypothetical protein [Clostridium sardiniense]MBY0757168.1 hypothetical protein [Clostridium sardiniense]MDQ0461658.1 uncharacterized protein YxeA [Clostridium sardiniense]
MKRKLLIGCIGILAIGIVAAVGIHQKNEKEATEKYLKEEASKLDVTEKQKEIMKSLNIDSSKVSDKYDESKENYFNFTREEVVKTRYMGIKFLEYVRPYAYDKGIDNETSNNIKKLTTNGLGDELAEQLKHLRPAPCIGFRKMEIEELQPVQYKKMEDGTVVWYYDIWEKAINNNDLIGKRQHSEITLLFVKDKDTWKIGEYSVHKYESK